MIREDLVAKHTYQLVTNDNEGEDVVLIPENGDAENVTNAIGATTDGTRTESDA